MHSLRRLPGKDASAGGEAALCAPQYMAVLLVTAVCATTAAADDWPHWRGPNRSDVTGEDSGWSAGKWPPSSPVWSKNVGQGCTSPIVAGNRLYVIGNSSGTDYVYCLDAASGAEIWKQSYACGAYGRYATGDQGNYAGTSSTPEYDAATGYLYTLSIDGHLNCWDTTSGNKSIVVSAKDTANNRALVSVLVVH